MWCYTENKEWEPETTLVAELATNRLHSFSLGKVGKSLYSSLQQWLCSTQVSQSLSLNRRWYDSIRLDSLTTLVQSLIIMKIKNITTTRLHRSVCVRLWQVRLSRWAGAAVGRSTSMQNSQRATIKIIATAYLALVFPHFPLFSAPYRFFFET